MVALKAIDNKEYGLNTPDGKKKARKKLFFIRSIFLFTWLSFSCLIFFIFILADINWMRPSVEQLMGHSLHRNVKLGRLSWHFGLRGFSVHTSRFLVAERTGGPFLMAGNCEIGFSLAPLIVGIGKIEYLDIQNPLFMAVQTGAKSWNFDDLLAASPDIDFIQIRRGHIFVVDRESISSYHRFPDTELSNVQIKLQRAGNFSPAQINTSFDLSGKSSAAQFDLTSKTWGRENKPWWEKPGHFELTAKRLTMENWQTIALLLKFDKKDLSSFCPASRLLALIPDFAHFPKIFIPTSGQFDLHATADGIASKNLNSSLQLKIDKLMLQAEDKSSINLPETSIISQIDLKAHSINWYKTVIRIPAYQLLFNTKGEAQFTDQGIEDGYQCSILGLLGDLRKLNPLAAFVYRSIPSYTSGSTSKELENLNGKLFLDLHFDKTQKNTHYIVTAKAADINIDGITPLLSSINRFTNNNPELSHSPFEGDYRQKLDLSKQAIFSGTIISQSDQGLTLQDCSLIDDQMSWKISGQADKEGHWTELVVSNKDLQLSRLCNKINRDVIFGKEVKAFLGLSAESCLELNGKAQIEAKINEHTNEENKLENKFLCQTIFDDAHLKISQPRLDLKHLNGVYEGESNKLKCKNIHFNLSDDLNSAVDIDASIPANANEALYFRLRSNKINAADLQQVLKLFHLETQFLDNWHLSGKLSDVDLFIKGTTHAPNITLLAIPDDLAFTLPNLKQSIHASSGKIIYNNNIFSLEKVNLSDSNTKCTISLLMSNTANTHKLEKLSLSIDSADLSDLQTYAPWLASTNLANSWSTLTKKFQITNLKGALSGTLDYAWQREKQHLNSMLEINGASFRQQKLLYRNLKGKISFADADIILHDITGNIDDTSFAVHGRLANYKDKGFQWQGEINAQVTPDHLNDLVSLFSPGQKYSINLQAKKTVSIKLKSHTHNMISSQSFTISAEPDTALSISVGSLTLNQPAKKSTINGSFSLEDQKLIVRNLNFDFAGSSINIQGIANNFKGTKDNNKFEPIYDLQLQTVDYIPASYIGQIFSYGVINSNLTGQVKSVLSLQGPAKSLSVTGKIFLADLAIPDLYLSHVVGIIICQPGPGLFPMSLQIDKFNFAEVELSQASGNLICQSEDNSAHQTVNECSVIDFKNLNARIAQGQLTGGGHMDLKTKKTQLNLGVSNANLSQLWPQLTSYQIKATGLLNGHFDCDTTGTTTKELEQNMVGSGQIHIGNGSFSRLALLHARLGQVNLIHQGIFGFNLNNVMQSVLPTKASEFNTIDTAFALEKETLVIRHVLYDGKDIKFSAAGKANLVLHNVDIDIAGVMPRVSNSVLGGKLGELSREITLQKLLDGVTMHKLDKLPALPLIGGIAGGPEIFTCRILAPYDQPKLISQSIQKSFRWLHNR